MANTIAVSILADVKDLKQNLDKGEGYLDGFANEAKTSANRAETAIAGVADAADSTASAASQAAGGIGDIAGALEATGFISEGMAQSMETGAAAIMGVTGAADLANLATEKLGLTTAVAKVQTVAKAAAEKVAAGATKAYAGVQAALNAVMAMNPIALVVIALVALVAALVIAYKKSETFRNIVGAAWDMIKEKTKAVFEWIQDKVSKVMDTIKNIFLNFTGPGLLIKHWNTIKTKTGAAFDWVETKVSNIMDAVKTLIANKAVAAKEAAVKAWEAIKTKTTNAFDDIRSKVTGVFESIVTFIKGVPGKISAIGSKFKEAGEGLMRQIVNGIKNAAGFIGDIAAGIWNAVKSSVNGAITSINRNLEFSIKIAGKSFGINPPDIPHLATGGIVTGPTLALIGEAGPEAVVPLNGKYAMGNTYIHNDIHVDVPVTADPRAVGRELVKAINAYQKDGGTRLL